MPIDPRHREIWARIGAHRFDEPSARLTFTARLARENGWTIGRAVRVVDEYRRFVFLAVTAGHPVTPSEDVDQAWHLHLAYTRDYWETFCREVLREPLHHGPTRGGAREADRYDAQYRRTLAAYAAAFDAPPPDDIWPSAPFMLPPKPRRTRQGDAVVHEAWTWFRESGQQQAWRSDKRTADCAPLAAALLGTPTLVGTAYATIHTAVSGLQARDNGGGGCSSSGGDGGGGG